MRKLVALLFAVSVLLVSAQALATNAVTLSGPNQLKYYVKYGKVLNAVTMAAPRSFTKAVTSPETNGVPDLTVLWVCLTDANNSVTLLTWSCTASHDGGTTDYTMQDTQSSAGTATFTDWIGQKIPTNIASPKCWPIRLDTAGFPEIECTFTPTGGAAEDLLTVSLSYANK